MANRTTKYRPHNDRGMRLRIARDATLVSQARLSRALAAHLGLRWDRHHSPAHIGAIENGRIYVSELRLDLLLGLIRQLAARERRAGTQAPGPANGRRGAVSAATSATTGFFDLRT